MTANPAAPSTVSAASAHDELLLGNMMRVRMVVAPIVVVLSALFILLDPVPWKLWWIALTLWPVAIFVVIEGLASIRRNRGFVRMRGTIAIVIPAQASLMFITGGIESPLLKGFPTFALVLGLFLGEPRRFLPPVALMSLFAAAFAAGPAAGFLPRSTPRFFFLGPGFWDRPVYVWVVAGVTIFLMFGASLIGGWTRRKLDRVTQQAIDARRQALAALESRNHEIVSAARTIAHELKNPLAAIRGLAQLVTREAQPGGKLHERLQVMLTEIDRMRIVLDGFRDLARPLGELAVERVRIGQVVADVAALSEGVAHARGARLALQVAYPIEVECDPQKLKQALLNLVQNGIEAAGAGGRVEVQVAPEGVAAARVTVRDNGPRVSPDTRRRLFTTGFTTKANGTGLGLVVARAIAEQHGGTLTLDFAAGGGCAASLVLPRELPPQETA